MTTTKDMQTMLIAVGHDVGPEGADGVLGTATKAAIAAFQRAAGVDVKWPGTYAAKTDAALRAAYAKVGGPIVAAPAPGKVLLPWMAEAERRLGMHEVRDNGALRKWLKSDGKTVGDPAKIAWCGDFVETCIGLTLPGEPLPANPYGARNWTKFGRRLTTPAYGAVLVFWRGSKSGWQGHVGFYAGEHGGNLLVLGGNQSNAITKAWLDDDRLLDIRWPSTFDPPTGGRVLLTSSGKLSTNEA
ncbi:TIGR02594 family protein [Xanthobacteraceae bacterium A53D]